MHHNYIIMHDNTLYNVAFNAICMVVEFHAGHYTLFMYMYHAEDGEFTCPLAHIEYILYWFLYAHVRKALVEVNCWTSM